MKQIVVGLAATALVVGVAQAGTNVVSLGTGDSLSVITDNSLAVQGTPATPARPATVVIKDDKDICELRLMFGIPAQVPTVDQIKEQMEASAQPMLANSVEGKVDIITLPNQSFSLLYFELTDKREDAGDGRFMLQGLGTSGRYMCQFMMLTNQKTSDAKAAILKALGTMTILSKK